MPLLHSRVNQLRTHPEVGYMELDGSRGLGVDRLVMSMDMEPRRCSIATVASTAIVPRDPCLIPNQRENVRKVHEAAVVILDLVLGHVDELSGL